MSLAFPCRIREENPGKNLLIILDNFRSHRANETVGFTLRAHIDLVYVPPVSPDLNLLKYIWKSIKRIVSAAFIQDLDHFKENIESSFKQYAVRPGYARKLIEKFMSEDYTYKIIGS